MTTWLYPNNAKVAQHNLINVIHCINRTNRKKILFTSQQMLKKHVTKFNALSMVKTFSKLEKKGTFLIP